MAQFMLFLRGDEVDFDSMSKDESEAHMQEFVAWSQSLHDTGKLLGVEKLEAETGGVLRRRGGEVVLDGPFTEAKELVLGYFAVDAVDLNAAIEIARTCPTLKVGGSVEVREVGSFPKPT